MNREVKDVVSLCDRMMEIIQTEFPQLTPPAACFALQQLLYTYHKDFGRRSDPVKRQPK